MEKIRVTAFPVVGIGGSAGGLEAFRELLQNLPDKLGMAFVFIMHLAPEHKSMLSELLSRETKMPVSEVKNKMLLEVNHVYVMPPNRNMSMASGKILLNNRKEGGLRHMPIDYFFRSLAKEQGNRAIGVILSGTATDGTLGAEAIKAEGGIVFAQDEKSAKYTGMPQNAVNAGCVDFVLSPEKIASELKRMAKHPYISYTGPVKTEEPITKEDKGLESIFDILRRAKGLDFTYYKTPTVNRRVSRRIVLLELKKLKDYIKFLRENKDEIQKLYEDLLINVTSFFRDPKVFDRLKKQVLPAILKGKKKDQAIRIWVPGCSSGEEAYSIAICILETLGTKAGTVPVQIFATDVSEGGIHKARTGIYGKTIKNNITPERLKRFFTSDGYSYRVSKQLRGMCVFSKQNVFSDPPLSNMNLISCRNLLIYLQSVLQKTVLDKFHYALRPEGFLLLGNSEAAGGYSNLFKTLDRKQRIFVKKSLLVRPELEFGQKYYLSKKLEIKEKIDIKQTEKTDIAGIVDRIVLNEYAPCGVLIDSNMEVVQFRGHTSRYLESAAGKPSFNVFKLAREGLFLALRTAIYKARKTKRTVKKEAVDVRHDGHRRRVNITVIPVKSKTLKEEFFLLLFDEIAKVVVSQNLPRARGKVSLKGKSVKSDKYINNLQKELAETKEYLQSVIEEQESAAEEIKSANEEFLSSNEELQSINEELETAKEELQSSNEELITANDELQNRNAETILLNNDLINLLSSINMPVVMMGTDLVIRRITSQAEKALNVTPADIGRPISKIKLNVDIPDLEKTLLHVIESLHPKIFEIKSGEGNWYSVYIRPYRTINNKIDGVVVIFVDITDRRKAQQIIKEARAYAENIIQTMQEPLIVLGDDLKVISANRSFYQTFKVIPQETQGQFIYDLGNRQWDIPKMRELLNNVLLRNDAFDNYEIEHNFEAIGQKTMILNARRLVTMRRILITINDITERKRAEERLRLIVETAPNGMIMVGQEGKITLVNSQTEKLFGYSREEVLGQKIEMLFAERFRTQGPAYLSDFFRKPKTQPLGAGPNLYGRKKDGSEFPMEIGLSPIEIPEGLFSLASIIDVTQRKKAEEQTAKLAAIVEASVDAIIGETLEGIVTSWNSGAQRLYGYHAQEIIGKSISVLVLPEHAEEFSDLFKKVKQGKQVEQYETVRIRKDRSLVDVAITMSPVTSFSTGEVIGASVIARDITEHKKAEEKLRKLDQLKTDFISTISHELRTPLSIIKEGINLVFDRVTGDINEKQEVMLGTLRRNIDRLARIIDELLDISKIEAGKTELKREMVDIVGLIRQVVSSFEVSLKKKNLEFKINVPEKQIDIYIDSDNIIQSFTNLIGNALKFTDRGLIEISLEEKEKEIVCVVADTGLGIAEENLPKVFSKFQQFGRLPGPGEKGTGLGLAITKGIIELHGGKIWVESKFGKGTKFSFILPKYTREEIFKESLNNRNA